MKTEATEAPHVGHMLNSHMRKHRYYKSALARDIGMNYETVVNFMRRPDIKVSYLWRICNALNYNFLAELAALLPPDMPSPPNAKDARIAELETQVQQLTTERDTLQRVLEILQQK
jgi:DNA-binding Xre family transcriptional regulator